MEKIYPNLNFLFFLFLNPSPLPQQLELPRWTRTKIAQSQVMG